MKFPPSLSGFATALLLFAGAAHAEEPREILIESLTAQSEVVIDYKNNIGWGTNGVVIRYTNAVLTAKQAMVNLGSGEAQAEGEVVLQRGNEIWRGARLLYNFKTRQIEGENFRTGRTPFFAKGGGLAGNMTNGTYVIQRALVTTDDVEDPAYSVRARSIKITEGKSIEARNATLFIGNVPVMFFPYYHRSLEQHPNHWVLTPGYRSLYGPFLLGKYNWFLSTNLFGSLDMDYREKRGVGGGPEFGWDLGRWGTGHTRFYYTHDDDPKTDPAGNPIKSNRQRFDFSYQASIRTNLTAKVVVREQSDAQIIRDFFEHEYRKDPQPKSFLEVNQLWSNWSVDALAQPQINDFFRTVERLPDVRLTGARQQLGISPFFYESDTSVGYFRFQPETGTNLNAYAAMRADSFHQLLLPQTYFGWLNFTPRFGARFTHYGESEGKDTVLNERDRSVFNTGAELSFKASQTWPGVKNNLFEVSGVRHIIEPSFNYVFVPSPSKAPPELPQFDTEIPSLRLLPINFPDYNAIDSIDSQNVVRLGLRNKVQTKRGDEIQNLVNWSMYTDWRIDPRSDQTQFSDFFSDLDLRPRSWLLLSSELRYGVDEGHIRYANNWLTLTPNDIWNLSLGYFYVREDPAFGPKSGNNLIRSSIYFRLNENWGFRTTHHFEARDGKLEEQYYTIYRDLRNWTAALTFRVRENSVGKDDFTVAFLFSLKAYPRFGVGKDRDHHSLLLGG